MHTLSRTTSRTAPAGKAERLGYGLVAVGYLVMTLGILEIGGLFNVVVGDGHRVGRLPLDVCGGGESTVRRRR